MDRQSYEPCKVCWGTGWNRIWVDSVGFFDFVHYSQRLCAYCNGGGGVYVTKVYAPKICPHCSQYLDPEADAPE